MKNKLFFIYFLTLFTFISFQSNVWAGDTTNTLKPELIHTKKAIAVVQLISQLHYRKMPLDDSLSSVIFDLYTKDLDANKLYFLASDVEAFEKYRTRLDDDIQSGNLAIPYEMFNRYRERISERLEEAEAILKQGFDFSKDEYFENNREDLPWAKNKKELQDIWRQYLKNQTLTLILNGKTQEEAVEVLTKRYNRYLESVKQFKSEDVFEDFMNALMTAYDPHSSYFSPISSDNFNISMSNSLEGIGAVLRSEDGYTTIVEVRAGGPAFLSNELKKDDRIIGVAQGDDGDFEDVVGWRLDEVVQKIRGKKGTVVRLQVIPAEAPLSSVPKMVRLVRDKITFEEQSASYKIINQEHQGQNYQVGVIELPSFYFDFEGYRSGDPNFKSTTKDVARILDTLKIAEVDGVILDLRYNGGGSLTEAIDLTGLFIKNGPVVQVKDFEGKVDLGMDDDGKQLYDGPLVVMVNRFSASASEIFSGAIQDYQRGVIVGEQTYGKGTVQQVISLDRYLTGEDQELGHINLTLAKFYRVTGSSTQHEGVTPDIELPSPFDKDIFGESAEPSALRWDEIRSASFQRVEDVSADLVNKLDTEYQQRLASNEQLLRLTADIEEMKADRENTKVSLNEEVRRQELEEAKAKEEERKKLEEENNIKYDLDDTYLENGVEVLLEMIEQKEG